MKPVGFVTSWMQDEVEESDVQTLEPMAKITNEKEVQDNSGLTPAHKELLLRIKMTETVIYGKSFAKLSTEKKKEFIDELKWLTALNAQIGG